MGQHYLLDRREKVIVVVGVFAAIFLLFSILADPKLAKTYWTMGISAVVLISCFLLSRNRTLFLVAVPAVILLRLVVGVLLRLMTG